MGTKKIGVVITANKKATYESCENVFKLVMIDVPDDGKDWHVAGETWQQNSNFVEKMREMTERKSIWDFLKETNLQTNQPTTEVGEITAELAITAYNAMRHYCKTTAKCRDCIFLDACESNNIRPDYWPDLKELV